MLFRSRLMCFDIKEVFDLRELAMLYSLTVVAFDDFLGITDDLNIVQYLHKQLQLCKCPRLVVKISARLKWTRLPKLSLLRQLWLELVDLGFAHLLFRQQVHVDVHILHLAS